MYNSLLISILVKIWNLILKGYEASLLKKVVDLIKKIVSYLLKGSVIKEFFTTHKDYVGKSLFYKLSANIIKFIDKILYSMNKYIKKIGKDSLLYVNIENLFETEIEVIRTFFIFVFFFGMGILANNLLRGHYSGKSYIVGILAIIGSVIGLLLKENYKNILDNSWVYNFVCGIFTIDEGGGNWW